MATLQFQRLSHTYRSNPAAGDWALKETEHLWSDGGAFALLGPSGCGKTTMLNILSGLLTPSRGAVLFDGRDVTGLSPQQRNIAQVFQFPVVYDTMSVRDNLSFPLRNRRINEAMVVRRVTEVAEALELEAELDCRAFGLGADAKQKISMGRGLVRTDVNAILLDEPLTVIDPELKWRLRSNLKSLYRRFRNTMVYVTHDQTEALTFADHIAVMHDGRIVQEDSPTALFETPRHKFVGHFIGSPGMNFAPCTVSPAGDAALLGGSTVPLAYQVTHPADGAGVEIGIRPEFVTLGREGPPAQIKRVADVGRRMVVDVLIEGIAKPFKASVAADTDIPAEPRVAFTPSRTFVYYDGWMAGARS